MKKPKADDQATQSTTPVALVTGAAGGIGMACVREFLKSGARVVMVDRERPAILNDAGIKDSQCIFIRTDISKETAVRKMVNRVVSVYGRLDVLVNNAAVLSPAKPVHSTLLAEFDAVIAVNLRGTFLVCKYSHPFLAKSRGCIVNISSMAGILGEKNHAAYAASKGAINALTMAMAVDYGVAGIRVNAICPGGVSTPGAEKILRSTPNAKALLKQRDALHALARTAKPEEIAAAVLFLASPAASFISGALIPVSGGMECGYGIKY